MKNRTTSFDSPDHVSLSMSKIVRVENTLLNKLFWILMVVAVAGCRVDDSLDRLKKTEWSPEVALPLVHADLSIADVLAQGQPDILVVGEDNKLSVTYDQVLYSARGSELLALIDHQLEAIHGQVNYPLGVLPNSILQYLELAHGELRLLLRNDGRSDIGEVQVNIPSLHIDGLPYEGHYVNISSLDETIPLQEAELFFLNGEDNEINISFTVKDLSGEDVTSQYKLLLQFRGLFFRKAKGWFDQFVLDFETDTIELDLFQNWKSGAVYLDDPKAMFSFNNSIGIPFSASLATFDASVDGSGATVIPIDYSNALGDSFAIEYPTSDDVEGAINSIFTLDRDNSNLQNVIKVSPKEVRYDLNLVAHHAYDLSEAGFISDTSRLVVSTAVELPFTGRIQNVLVVDTLELSTKFIGELDDVLAATIEVRTENSLPLEVDLQAYFLDANGAIIDSLFNSPEFLESGVANAQGRVTQASLRLNAIQTTAAQLDRLRQARYLALRGKMNTFNQGNTTISFYDDSHLAIDLALKLKYRVQ